MMIKTIKAKEGLKLGDSYMNNDLRDQFITLAESLPDATSDEQAYENIDKMMSLIRTATLDEAIQALKFCDQGEFISVYVRAIEQLKDKDNE